MANPLHSILAADIGVEKLLKRRKDLVLRLRTGAERAKVGWIYLELPTAAVGALGPIISVDVEEIIAAIEGADPLDVSEYELGRWIDRPLLRVAP